MAFIVAEKLGIDNSEYLFPYIASWSDGKQLEQLKNALKEIQEASRQISSAIESELLKLRKRELSMKDKLYDVIYRVSLPSEEHFIFNIKWNLNIKFK